MLRPMELYELILDNIYNGVLITDAQGNVIYMNRPYGEFLGLDPQAQVGRHCTEVLEFSRMHIVAQTGRAELNQAQWINGQNMVVQRIPIRKDDQVVAVYGQVMFKNAREVGDLAARLSLLQSKVEMYKQELIHLRATRYTFESIVGATPAILDLKKTARRAAHGDAAVLISGESGTGKELFAQAIHQASPRSVHPFVRINCAAIPHDLLESELFGYASGAFTGASAKGKPGKFELAHQGTIFLDEIGELPLEMQPKLLEALEEKAFERVGGTTVIQSDFRLIAATNQHLETLIEKNRFRADLYYRLNVIPIQIPPLRERTADIPLLARHILDQLTQESARPPVTLSGEAEHLLNAYRWPGNVRELVNAMERILLTLEGRTIQAQHLPFHIQGTPEAAASYFGTRNLKQVLERTEAELIRAVLSDAGGNKVEAARQLGIHRTHLYKKLAKIEATPDRPAS
ncbi:sigma-54 interaction domain-containing protein [Desulfatitalea tepidiphila]|uniref:sigma-54 interaction domain-containing protein n=1 Tax=Desulfatitalea tepidiphila TaxID=1185843 RepID=UPI0006B42177|nr:sigma 54-interacting transcriptional regulator [Desulfatitalea tepidiphila]